MKGVCTIDLPSFATLAEREAERVIATGLFPGAILCCGTREGGMAYTKAIGLAQLEPCPKAMGEDAIFDVASITKAVATASAAAICWSEGLLDPEKPLPHYLPEMRAPGTENIKIRHLATHYSGFDNSKYDHKFADGDILSAISSATPVRKPETKHEYACLNIILLGLIIEKISGTPLAEFCTKNIFEPLGMKDTAFGPLKDNLDRVVPSQVAAGTISDEQARAAVRPIGNAGLFSTAHDLAIFAEMMLNGGMRGGLRALPEKAVSFLSRPWTKAPFAKHAFVWNMQEVKNNASHRPDNLSDDAYGHGGFTGQSLWIDPKKGIYTIVMSNWTHPRLDYGKKYIPANLARARLGELLIDALNNQRLRKQDC
ncbi:MAG: hypothetical protein A2X49_05980 [Lentisphaerae bacterium GWF2_52_8]|nr:MAG: hypothetical protein A2X49_05980 [Lentisphaerae bacterium GWF2_52_8]